MLSEEREKRRKTYPKKWKKGAGGGNVEYHWDLGIIVGAVCSDG